MPQAANDNIPYRINWTTGGLMAGVAILIDTLQFLAVFLNVIPGLGVIVGFYLTILGYCIFCLWFALQRVSFSSGKKRVSFSSGKKAVSKLLTTIVSAVAEFMPFIGALPMTTVNVVMITLMARAEDREEAKEKAAQEAAQMEAYYRQYAQVAAANARLEEESQAAMLRAAANDTEPEEEVRAA